MAHNRLLDPILTSSWPADPDSEAVVFATTYQVYERKGAKLKKGKTVVRITDGTADGDLLMELNAGELMSARKLLAQASVETSNYVNGDDAAACEVVREPRFSTAVLEFGQGKTVVAVHFTALDGGGLRRRIHLSLGRYGLWLPHFDCLG